MHCATSLDMEQSECQNSLEHTFFSLCSHISCLSYHWNKTPAHSIIVITTKTKDGDTHATYADIDDKQTVGNAATCSSQHVATLETIMNKEEESKKKSHTTSEKAKVNSRNLGLSYDNTIIYISPDTHQTHTSFYLFMRHSSIQTHSMQSRISAEVEISHYLKSSTFKCHQNYMTLH